MQIQISLTSPINQSCQVGDIVHYVKTGSVSTFDVNTTPMVYVGSILSISDDGTYVTLTCNITPGVTPPSVDDFILFSKDRRVNETSLLGYYAEFEFKNDSNNRAELFMTGCEVTPNS